MISGNLPLSIDNADDEIIHMDSMTLTLDHDRSILYGFPLFKSNSLWEHALFIISGGTLQFEDIPYEWQYKTAQLTAAFGRITSPESDEEKFYNDIVEVFRFMFGLELHLIVNDGITENTIYPKDFLPENAGKDNLDKNAFMYVLKKNWQCFSIYWRGFDGKSTTVFARDEMLRRCTSGNLIEKLNLSTQDQVDQENGQIQSDPISNDHDEQRSTETVDAKNYSNASVPELSQTTVQSQHQLECTSKTLLEVYNDLKQILMTYGSLFTNERIQLLSQAIDLTNLESRSLNERNNLLLNHLNIISSILANRNNAPILQENEAMDTSKNTLQSNPDEQNRSAQGSIVEVESSISQPEKLSVEAPEIFVQPNPKSRARNMLDLVPKLKKDTTRTKSAKEAMPNDKKCPVGLLQGTGRQRTLVEIKVPKNLPENGCLACQVHTVEHHPHPLKLIVPKDTTAIKNMISHENNLDCLDLRQIDSTILFDKANKIVYFEITSEDRKAGVKEIPVFLLTLYQNNHLTKAKIEEGQWWNCQLAFWFCKNSSNHYESLSRTTWSNPIMQKMPTQSNKNTAKSMNKN